MEIAGYLASLLIGITLGLIGGGGSILTVPVLVYLFLLPPPLAIFYSLFIVGFTSLVGAFTNYRKGRVNFQTAFLFGASSMATVILVRKFVVPLLPDVIFTMGTFKVTQDLLLMVLFAILMVAASFSMIRSGKVKAETVEDPSVIKLIIYGILIGLVTAFLGAGGGFLLIPALVIFMKLPMKTAIGTSLLIIAMNSLTGFAVGMGDDPVEWRFVLTILAIAIAGLFIGSYFNQKVDAGKLKKGFGWFVLAMGIFVILKETVLL